MYLVGLEEGKGAGNTHRISFLLPFMSCRVAVVGAGNEKWCMISWIF